MNLVFVGWNHRGAPLDLRERLSFTPERALEALEGLFRERILSEGAIIFTPMHAKRFMRAMQENIERYEVTNGKIQDLEQIEIPMNFGGPTAQA